VSRYRVLGVIPARFHSTRFEGKPLVDIQGTSMIMRVYRQARQAKLLSDVVVATDDARIYDHVQAHGGNVVMTSAHHPNGTSRCAEVLSHFDQKADGVMNVQGDEPFIEPSQIDQVAELLQSGAPIATLAIRVEQLEELASPNRVKVVMDSNLRALYFSRSMIPYVRDKQNDAHAVFYKHIGLYGYQADVLRSIVALPVSKLEQAESLEQLRWLEAGIAVHVGITEHESFSVDVPEDLEKLPGYKQV
jgi:3-deoxy-manno-octulosonate cytidylyltransferase (CMP-KDO synthetase)